MECRVADREWDGSNVVFSLSVSHVKCVTISPTTPVIFNTALFFSSSLNKQDKPFCT